MSDPTRTIALLVGVETYAFGPSHNLPGPINDAIRFANWLLARGVPPTRIQLFLSPPATHTPHGQFVSTPLLATPAALPDEAVRDARADTIKAALETLGHDANVRAHDSPEILILFWSGHGLVDDDGEHVLVCQDANAQNLANHRLRALTEWLRTKYFGKKLQRQIFVVDTCADDIDRATFPHRLPCFTPPGGTKVAGRDQRIFHAAARGLPAINISLARQGLFAGAMMDMLKQRTHAPWPFDAKGLRDDLLRHFKKLRRENAIPQLPCFSFRGDWEDGGIEFAANGATPPPSSPAPFLLQIQVRPVAEAFLDGGLAANGTNFELVCRLLRETAVVPISNTPAAPLSRPNALAAAINAVIDRAIRYLGRDKALDHIELVLPHEFLDSQPDRFEFKSEVLTLGEKWQLTLRSYERAFDESDSAHITAYQDSRTRWASLPADTPPDATLQLWRTSATASDRTFARNLRMTPVFIALDTAPLLSATGEPDTLFRHLIRSGAPIALWLHDAKIDETRVREFLTTHLLSVPAIAWPQTLRALREDHFPNHPDRSPCSGLTLLWEHPAYCPRADELSAPLLSTP